MNKVIFFFFISFASLAKSLHSERSEKKNTEVENSLQKFCDLMQFFTEVLEDFNDKHLGRSEWGTMLGYEEIKPRLLDGGTSRGLKKMSMSMMPLMFHVGATSTWMILVTILAAKSVAIGLILLVFKIAVSSAKVASFFTLLKSKHADHHEYSWPPHGHISERSVNAIPIHADWNYAPDWKLADPYTGYKSGPSYKNQHFNSKDVEKNNI